MIETDVKDTERWIVENSSFHEPIKAHAQTHMEFVEVEICPTCKTLSPCPINMLVEYIKEMRIRVWSPT